MATVPSFHLGDPHVARLLEITCTRFADLPALRWLEDEDWVVMTWREVQAKVHQISRALISAGIQRSDRVAIFSHNVAEWLLCDWAIMSVGAATVAIYSTSTPDQIAHILSDSGSSMIFVETTTEAERVAEVIDDLPSVKQIVSFRPVSPTVSAPVTSLAEFCLDEIDSDGELERQRRSRLAELSTNDLNSIVYTSGTTGNPKGVMLSHRAMMAQMDSLSRHIFMDLDDHSLCFLPLAHAFERGWSTYVMLHGSMNTMLPNPREIADMMVKAKPTMMVSVPKLFETVYRVAHEKVAESPTKKRIFNWALRVGDQAQCCHRAGEKLPWRLRLALPIADKLVLHSIRRAVGGRKRIFVCGGAAMRPEVETFFAAAGLPVLNGYGMTEAAPLITFNSPDIFKVGTVGRVMPGGELKIGQDGEICYRGPNLMDSYWNNPEATAETIIDGWLHTGDVGTIDEDGFLTITDRLKDIIVTSGGKNVAPQPIEGMILADPFFEQAVVLGDDRPFLTMLMKPSMPKMSELADSLHLSFENLTDLMDNQEILEWVKKRISKLTEKLPSQEQIRDIRILPEGFSLENGLMTPSLKIKRREVEARFKNLIDEMYEKVAESRKAAMRAAKAVTEVLTKKDDEHTDPDSGGGAVSTDSDSSSADIAESEMTN